jgi:hypothetical protein
MEPSNLTLQRQLVCCNKMPTVSQLLPLLVGERKTAQALCTTDQGQFTSQHQLVLQQHASHFPAATPGSGVETSIVV